MRKKGGGRLKRRDFLSLLLKSAAGLLGVGGLSILPYLYPAGKNGPRDLEFIKALDEEELPRRGVKSIEFRFRGKNLRAYVVRAGDELFALSPVCTHLGCLVRWNYFDSRFDCPCHGGKYDIRGNVIEGPPPRPLTRVPFKLEGGAFYIGMKA